MRSTNILFVLLFSASLLHFSLSAFPLSSSDLVALRNTDSNADDTFYRNSTPDNSLSSIANLQSNCDADYVFSDRAILKEKYDFELYNTPHSTDDDDVADKSSRYFLGFHGSFSEFDIFTHEIKDIFPDFPQSSLPYLDSFQPFYQLNLLDSCYLRAGLVIPSSRKLIELDNYKHFLVGPRIEAGLDEHIFCGFNITQDLAEIMDIDNSGLDIDMLSQYDNWDYCFDFNIKNFSLWEFKALDFKAEIANILFNKNIQDPSKQLERHSTYKISLAGKIEKLLFDCGYERIEPNFYTDGDYTSVDEELFRANLNYKFFDWLKLKAGYTAHRNNLDDLLTETIQSQTPQVSLFVNPLPGHKNLSLDFSYKCHSSDSSDEGLKSTKDIYRTMLRYMLEQGYISLTDERQTDADTSSCGNYSHSGTTTFALGLKQLEIIPFFQVSTSVNSSIKRTKYGGFPQQDEFQKIMANFALEYRDFLSLKSSYFMENSDMAEEFADSTSHGWGLEIIFKPRNKLDTEFSLRYGQRKNDYEDNSEDYEDKFFEARINFKL